MGRAGLRGHGKNPGINGEVAYREKGRQKIRCDWYVNTDFYPFPTRIIFYTVDIRVIRLSPPGAEKQRLSLDSKGGIVWTRSS